MKQKQIVSLFLAVALLLALAMPVCAASPGLSNFKKQAEYTGFSDVPIFSWYEESVKTVCEYGLMAGTDAGLFKPKGEMTLAEGLAIACRLHNIYYGGTGEFEQSSPWFQVYVDYAAKNDILSFTDDPTADFYTGIISKEIFAYLITHALPKDAYKDINHIGFGLIPGVTIYTTYAEEIYQLFNAGILTGSDSSGTFNEDDRITRAEASAILSRVILPDLRKTGSVKARDISVYADPYYFNDKGNLYIDDANRLIYFDVYVGQSVQNSTVTCKSSNESIVTVSSVNRLDDHPANHRMVIIASKEIAGSADLKISDAAGNTATVTVDVSVSQSSANSSSSSQTPQKPQGSGNTTSSNQTTSTTTPPANCNYVINTNTGKFHYSWCKSVAKMSEKNKWYYTGTRDSVINMGYVPCKNCNP